MTKSYPKILTEAETLELAIAGQSLARYGDGEYNHCFGRKNVSQPADKGLTKELCEILLDDDKRVLPCIPNVFSDSPKKANWLGYAGPHILGLLRDRVYGSSFVSRPDSAPWIDTPVYWDRVKDLWRGKDVALVAGTMRSLRPDMMPEAASVKFITAPSGQKGDGAYAKVNELEEEAAAFPGTVLLCLGPTATVLASRLAKRGVHAVDLGHVGMFMRSAGAYRYVLDDLISPQYRELLMRKHDSGKWGSDGAKHVENVMAFREELKPETILDYGCGEMRLAEALKPIRVSGFDPGIVGRQGMPKPCDLTVCTDVLEHVERDRLQNVFGHLHSITLKGSYVVIATRKAKAILPDGRNAHLIVQEAPWWMKGLETAGFKIQHSEIDPGKEVRLWLLK